MDVLYFADSGSVFDSAIPSVLGAGVDINPSSVGSDPETARAVFFGLQTGWDTAFTDQFIGFQTSVGNEGYLQVSWSKSRKQIQDTQKIANPGHPEKEYKPYQRRNL